MNKHKSSTSTFQLTNRANLLFIFLGGFFIANALIAELIGVKIFAFEDTFGLDSFNWNLFGETGSLNFTAGVLLWPVVFIMTDVINEYFGERGVKVLSYLTVGLIIYAFFMIYMAINLAPADWWVGSEKANGVSNMQSSFRRIFGQGMWIIAGSVIAFLIGQLVDVLSFHRIRKMTGESMIWARATGSTIISQLIDSIVVLYIAFVLPGKWTISMFLAIATVNYCYKVIVAIVLTPTLYLLHNVIDSFLGERLAAELKQKAAGE